MKSFRLPSLWAALALPCACAPAHADVFRPWAQETARSEYSGTSSATKPVSGVKPGALFRETDTLHQYRYTGSPDGGASTDWAFLPDEFTLGTLLSYEDQTNSVARVEQQYSYKACTADCQVKASPGFVHTVTCATSAGAAVAAAGALTIRDALTETTPIAATIGIPATAFVPFTLHLDEVMTTGIYFAYDGSVTAASVSCSISYR